MQRAVTSHLIFYVSDQEVSTRFYEHVFGRPPELNVPGMSEFRLSPTCILGLMPEQGIKRLLGETIADPALARGIPRAELYLRLEEPEQFLRRATEAGAKLLSGLQERGWGDSAGYVSDPDGHVIAFASALTVL